MIIESPQQLMAPARIQDIPKDVKILTKEPQGYRGLCIGRDEELERISAYFNSQYEAEAEEALDESDCIACIITNAPGAGKTTLREKFIRDQRELGTTCIELTTGDLLSTDDFVQAPIDHAAPDPKDNEPLPAPEVKTVRNTLRALWKARNVYVPPVIGAVTGALTVPDMGMVANVLTGTGMAMHDQLGARFVQELHEHGDLTPKRALRLLSDTYEGKYLLTVDEGHVLGDGGVDRGDLLKVISAICNPAWRKDAGIRGGGLLLSGLGIVKDNLDGLGLSRAEVIWLRSLTEAEAETIVRHEINRLPEANLSGERRERVLDEWPKALARSFHP